MVEELVPETVLGDNAVALAALQWVRHTLRDAGVVCTERTTKSQVAFGGRRGFAYVWDPGRYLRGHVAPVVLSLAFGHQVPSVRWKEVAHPTPTTWMHHLEIRAATELDDEVKRLLLSAAAEQT